MEKYISVIVPVYNAEKYLRECIESIVNQYESFSAYELILIDDGSTDKSLSICKEYEYLDYVRVFSQKNGGPSLARNNGLSKAEGKYILYVDSDDYIAENSFYRIVSTCKEQKEPDLFFLNGCKLYEGNRKVVIEKEYDFELLKNKSRSEIFSYLAKRNKFNGSPCLKMLKRQFLLDNKILFEVGKRCEDLDWSMDCYLNAKTYGCFNGMYYFYRQGIPSSNSARFQDNSYRDWKKIIDKWIFESEANINSDIKVSLLQFACYEYIIMLVNCKDYIKNDIEWHQERKKLFRYRKDKMTRMVGLFCKLLGTYNTSRLLNMYYRMR